MKTHVIHFPPIVKENRDLGMAFDPGDGIDNDGFIEILAWPSIRVTGSITTVLVIVSPHCSGVSQNGIVEIAIELGFKDNLSRSPPCCFYDSYYPPSNPNFFDNFFRFSIGKKFKIL